MSEENRQSSYPDSTTGFGGDINSNDTYEKPYDQETAAGYGGDDMCQETAAGYGGDDMCQDTAAGYGGDDMCQETAAGYGGDYSCMNEKQTTTEDGYGQDSCGGGVDYYFEDKPAGKSHEDFEKEKKHHKHLQQIGELGTAAAGAYALIGRYHLHECTPPILALKLSSRKMNQETGSGLDFQVETSAELLQKYKLKVENITASRGKKGNAASKEVQKNLLFNQANAQVTKSKRGASNPTQRENVVAVRQSKRSALEQNTNKDFNFNRVKPQIMNNTRGVSNPSEQEMSAYCGSIQKSMQKENQQGGSHSGTIPIQKKRHDQNKRFLNTKVVTKKLGYMQVPCEKKPVKSTIRGQVEPIQKLQDNNEEFFRNINSKRQLRTTMTHEVQEVPEEHFSKKKKPNPKCPVMSLDEFINKNKKQHENDETESEYEEENDMNVEVEGDINHESNEGIEENGPAGATSVRKRGKTLCLKVHARGLEDRKEIILNAEGQPIGPDEKTLSELSSFLGTIARSADLCPLIYTNWKAVNKGPIWAYVNKKFHIQDKGKKYVYAIINDAWRRHKYSTKKDHFTKYRSLRECLKNRPKEIPEEHFKELIEYWKLDTVKAISHQNSQNTSQQKWRHRVGPISFARIRERLRAKKENKESPTRAEVFIETRQIRKGKKLDPEINEAVTKLQDLIKNSGKSSEEAFESVFGNEKPGRVRCHGRTTTRSLLKKKEELAEMEKRHATEVKVLNDKIQELENKCARQMAATDEKFRLLLTMLNPNKSGMDLGAFAAFLSTTAYTNHGLHSSTSTYAPCDNEYEKHEAKKYPEHAHEHKIEEEVAVAAKKEAKKDEEEAEGHKKHHFFNDLFSLITTNI
ncbi:unnamed protein product [Cuscuta epithymum]|uniref:Transposase, Ptta/En/Spm, plant n=1 Tax=Cuscuta epithymum TaxID=186058 RepID=A0AAV0E4H2_9ASTE|nr:unnamed protein product [Cuscuta epithymum]